MVPVFRSATPRSHRLRPYGPERHDDGWLNVRSSRFYEDSAVRPVNSGLAEMMDDHFPTAIAE